MAYTPDWLRPPLPGCVGGIEAERHTCALCAVAQRARVNLNGLPNRCKPATWQKVREPPPSALPCSWGAVLKVSASGEPLLFLEDPKVNAWAWIGRGPLQWRAQSVWDSGPWAWAGGRGCPAALLSTARLCKARAKRLVLWTARVPPCAHGPTRTSARGGPRRP